MPIRSQISSIMSQIEPEHLELFALELGKIAENDCLHTIIYKYQPINTKFGSQVYDHKILDEFDYGTNWKNIQSYLPFNLKKTAEYDLLTLYHLQILTNQHQTWSKCM